MYTEINFRTKKALKEAIAAGKDVGVFQPGPFGANVPTDGKITLEGPHYPQAHSWYATAVLKDSRIVKVN